MPLARLLYASTAMFLSIFLAALFVRPVRAEITAISISDLQPIYDQWCAGILSGNYGPFREYLAPDYIYVTTEGKRRTRDQQIAIAQANKVTWMKCTNVVRDLWQSGGRTKVVATNALWGTLNGARVEYATTFIDVWTVVGGKPQNLSSTDLDAIYVVGGKAHISQLSSQVP